MTDTLLGNARHARVAASAEQLMADYYPLIAKAVTGLDAQDRRALYQRGRDALLAELRAVNPPLSEQVIMDERIAFEKAIRRIESEAAHRTAE